MKRFYKMRDGQTQQRMEYEFATKGGKDMRGITEELPYYFALQEKMVRNRKVSTQLVQTTIAISKIMERNASFKHYEQAFLSLIGLGALLKFDQSYFIRLSDYKVDVDNQFLKVMEELMTLSYIIRRKTDQSMELQYAAVMSQFLRLGELLGIEARDISLVAIRQ